MMDPCIEDLGTLSASASSSGSWTNECASENRTGRYARYYSFTLAADSVVTIDLTSSDANAYLYLMRGVDKGGAIVASDDDGGNGRNSRIARALQPGQYTIEATTSSGTAIEGSFELAIDTTALTFCAYEGSGNDFRLAEIAPVRPMVWDGKPGVQFRKSNGRARAATTALPLVENSSVTISMSSSDVDASPYAYLIDGAGLYGDVIGEGASLRYTLRPGTYTVEATTAEPRFRRRHETRNPDVSDPYHNEQCTFGARSAYMERTWLRRQWHKGGHHRRGIRQLRQGWRGSAADHQG